MTKITNRAFGRKFEEDKFGRGIRRDKPIEALRKTLGDCAHCFQPIYVSPGQLYARDNDGGFSHKECRKKRKFYAR